MAGWGSACVAVFVSPPAAPWRLSLSAPKYVDKQKFNNINNKKKKKQFITAVGTSTYFIEQKLLFFFLALTAIG